MNEDGGCLSGITDFHQSEGMARFRCDPCDYDLCQKCINCRDDRVKLPSEDTRSTIRMSLELAAASGDLARALAIVEKDAATREKDAAAALEKTRALIRSSLEQALASGSLARAIVVVASG